MLEKEFKYYLDNQERFLKKYKGKFVVISKNNVVGAYDSILEAYRESKKKYELGTFLIQKCTPGKSSYTYTFHSNVSFG